MYRRSKSSARMKCKLWNRNWESRLQKKKDKWKDRIEVTKIVFTTTNHCFIKSENENKRQSKDKLWWEEIWKDYLIYDGIKKCFPYPIEMSENMGTMNLDTLKILQEITESRFLIVSWMLLSNHYSSNFKVIKYFLTLI